MCESNILMIFLHVNWCSDAVIHCASMLHMCIILMDYLNEMYLLESVYQYKGRYDLIQVTCSYVFFYIQRGMYYVFLCYVVRGSMIIAPWMPVA